MSKLFIGIVSAPPNHRGRYMIQVAENKKSNNIGIRLYDLGCQICAKPNLDVETVYNLSVE